MDKSRGVRVRGVSRDGRILVSCYFGFWIVFDAIRRSSGIAIDSLPAYVFLMVLAAGACIWSYFPGILITSSEVIIRRYVGTIRHEKSEVWFYVSAYQSVLTGWLSGDFPSMLNVRIAGKEYPLPFTLTLSRKTARKRAQSLNLLCSGQTSRLPEHHQSTVQEAVLPKSER
jgi:hypothetical protein